MGQQLNYISFGAITPTYAQQNLMKDGTPDMRCKSSKKVPAPKKKS
jgi:hypothetical protein